ncbi:MAG: holo-ACP synthase [Deinococcus sp.]|nr:holo-ACP synthase [Deinococcus sp.]
MVLGIGVDIVEVERVARAVANPRFIARVFTPAEAAYCQSRGRGAAQHFAGRFAAKEAALKALGCGLRGEVRWHDVEVLNDQAGRPVAQLHGAAREQLARLGGQVLVSIAHAQAYAVAQVVITSQQS